MFLAFLKIVVLLTFRFLIRVPHFCPTHFLRSADSRGCAQRGTARGRTLPQHGTTQGHGRDVSRGYFLAHTRAKIGAGCVDGAVRVREAISAFSIANESSIVHIYRETKPSHGRVSVHFCKKCDNIVLNHSICTMFSHLTSVPQSIASSTWVVSCSLASGR